MATKLNCLDCIHYRPERDVADGWEEVFKGDPNFLKPKMKTVPHHCALHPEAFKKWWEENKDKQRDESETLSCLEPHEHLKQLSECIRLAEDVLASIKERKETNNG